MRVYVSYFEEVQWEDRKVSGIYGILLLQAEFLLHQQVIGHAERVGLVQEETVFA